MPEFTLSNPETVPAPRPGSYSNLAEIPLGDRTMLVLAGQVALDEHRQLVGGDDMRVQTACVFDLIEAILASRGATFADVYNVRTFLTDISRITEYGEVRNKYLPATPPTSTTVEVSKLFIPGALLEVEVSAII
jgi:2-iminobutanoate/2-iminopropanoate deaminase